jgi:putative membrane protein
MDQYVKTLLLIGVLTGASVAAASPHRHQHSPNGSKPTSAQLTLASQDGAIPATFVKKAALDGITEVELGRIALLKSRDPKIREFAERMVKDHGKTNEELGALAKRKGLSVPMALDPEHRSAIQAVNARSGAAFDLAYSQHTAGDHSKAIALFQGAITGPDQDLAAFAKETLPTLEQHKELADSLIVPRTADASGSVTFFE